MKRKNISPKTRFEVFKRDKFTCQYCGAKAPDVILHADHIEPHSKGGSDDALNLITACKDCNGGKGDRRISDESLLSKTRDQLAELEEKRQQLELMAQWQKSLVGARNQETDALHEHWKSLVPGFYLLPAGMASLRALRQTYSFGEIADAMEKAVAKYGGKVASPETVDEAWAKVPGVCRVTRLSRDNPDEARLYYCKGILRNRLSWTPPDGGLSLLRDALHLGVPVSEIEAQCKRVKTWTDLKIWVANSHDRPF